MVVNPKLTTIEEFEAFIAKHPQQRFELIEGEVIEKMPTEEHAVLAATISGEIYLYLKKNPIGRVAVEPRHRAPDDIHNDRLPDVAFTTHQRALPLTKRGAVPQMPDLAVEIQSPDDKLLEMREKAIYYLKNGASLVWLVLPTKQQIEVHRADAAVRTYAGGETLHAEALLPGFALSLNQLFDLPEQDE